MPGSHLGRNRSSKVTTSEVNARDSAMDLSFVDEPLSISNGVVHDLNNSSAAEFERPYAAASPPTQSVFSHKMRVLKQQDE